MSTARSIRLARSATARSVWEELPDDDDDTDETDESGPIEAAGNDHFDWPDWDQGREADPYFAAVATDRYERELDARSSQ